MMRRTTPAANASSGNDLRLVHREARNRVKKNIEKMRQAFDIL
jgi:hypothetical protein